MQCSSLRFGLSNLSLAIARCQRAGRNGLSLQCLEQEEMQLQSRWKDKLGIAASALCAVHCAATPLLLVFLPAMKFTEWMASPLFHQIAATVCSALVAIAIWPAFRKTRDYAVLGLSTAGLVLIVSAAFVLPDQCCSSHSNAVAGIVDSHDDHDHGHSHAGHSHASHAHEGHDHSHTETSSETLTAGVGVSSTLISAVAPYQPWMTPIGGCLLIIAHSLNLLRRRSSCGNSNCQCATRSADLLNSDPPTVSMVGISRTAELQLDGSLQLTKAS